MWNNWLPPPWTPPIMVSSKSHLLDTIDSEERIFNANTNLNIRYRETYLQDGLTKNQLAWILLLELNYFMNQLNKQNNMTSD